MRKKSGLNHQLIKHTTHYECTACHQTWKSRPKTQCPGVKMYPRHDYSPLLTQDQLKYLSYDTSARHLPAPVGCYYAPGAGVYVSLYDPAQAVKRKTPNKRRITDSITDLYWPLSAVPVLEHMRRFMAQRKSQDYPQYRALNHEIANIAAAFHAFTPAEIEQFGGGALYLSISPSLIRRFYPSERVNEDEQSKLVTRIIAAYQRSIANHPTKNGLSDDRP